MIKIGNIVKVKKEYKQKFKNRTDKFDYATVLDIMKCPGLKHCTESGKKCPGGIVLNKTKQKCWYYDSVCILEVI